MFLLAILLSAASCFALGALWYSPVLFGKLWQSEEGLSDEQIKQTMEKHGAKPFIFSFVYAVLAAVGFYVFIRHSTSLGHNLAVGIIVGILLVATSFGVNYQFANRGNKLFLIDTGYHVVQFILYAIVFWYLK